MRDGHILCIIVDTWMSKWLWNETVFVYRSYKRSVFGRSICQTKKKKTNSSKEDRIMNGCVHT